MIEHNVRGMVVVGETLLEPGPKVRVTFRYEPETDPLSVTAIFRKEDEEDDVEWTISRELLARAITSEDKKYGEGDVKGQAVGQLFILCLSSPEGHADVKMPRLLVVAFLEATMNEVPLGEENLDDMIDAFIGEVLG